MSLYARLLLFGLASDILEYILDGLKFKLVNLKEIIIYFKKEKFRLIKSQYAELD